MIIIIFSIIQTWYSIKISEKTAKDLRDNLLVKITNSSYQWVQKHTPSELLTNFTSDVDNVKFFVSQGIVSSLTAIVLLLGSIILILTINLKLGLIAISILPIILIVFVFIFSRIGPLFRKSQENISKLNKVVNESIVGAMLIRVLNSQSIEESKFATVNETTKQIGYKIINLFSSLIH